MFAKCKDEKGNFKLCPFRVHQQAVGPTTTTQTFYSCIGDKCIAYKNGQCLRLRSE